MTGDIIYEGSSADEHETTIAITNPTQDNIITVPDSDQTIGTATTVADGAIDSLAQFADLETCDGSDIIKRNSVDTAWICVDGTEVTLSGSETDGYILVYDTGSPESFKDVPMGGDVSMDETGDVTIQAGVIEETMMATETFGDFACGSGTDDCNIVENVVDMTAISDSINFATTGTITGAIDVVKTIDGSETDLPMLGQMYLADHNTSANDTTYTLPGAALGLSACFYDNGNGDGGIILDPVGDDHIQLNGTNAASGENINSPGVADAGENGDFLCLLGTSVNEWITLGQSGIWVEATPP
jgi:hypothetical protein